MNFHYDGDTWINIEDPNLTDEELVWERLIHGVRKERLDTILQQTLAEELRKEIDKDLLKHIRKLAEDDK